MKDTVLDGEFKREYGILCRRFYPSALGPTPFGASSCRVAVGETTAPHAHTDGETFLILAGSGTMTIGTNTQPVAAGDVVYLPPGQTHQLMNSGETELRFVSLWWDPATQLGAPPTALPGRALIVSAPPTPNGDLHLGHLSGPYLAADVYRRYLEAEGVCTHYHSGTDDHQSYLPTKARQLGKGVETVTETFATAIASTLEAAGMQPHSFRRPSLEKVYQNAVRDFFAGLVASGAVERRASTILFCPPCNQEIFEAFARGLCPHCQRPTNSHGCEACGSFNQGTDLRSPTCNLCGTTATLRTAERYVFAMERYRQPLTEYADRVHGNARLKRYYRSLFAKPLPEIRVSFAAQWGIAAPVPGEVLYEWLEMAAGYSLLAKEREAATGVNPFRDPGTEFSLFFGFDNTFFYSAFIPALLLAEHPEANPKQRLPRALLSNEFYHLDGEKFSTSRNHAIWGREFLANEPRDCLRLFLSWDRPENEQTSFSQERYSFFKKALFEDKLTRTLRGVSTLLDSADWPHDELTNASSFTLATREIDEALAKFHRAFRPESFSLRSATRTALELCDILSDAAAAIETTAACSAESKALLNKGLAALTRTLTPFAPELARKYQRGS